MRCVQLHRQIRDHAAKRSAGHPERANDVKLSRGGIREIEFTVQLLAGGARGPVPRAAPPPHAGGPATPGPAGLMPQETADAMARAYVFCARWSTASSTWTTSRPMCCPRATTTWPGLPAPWATLTAAPFARADAHRELVAQEFDTLLGGNEKNNAAAAAAAAPRHRPRHRPSWKACWNNCPKTFARTRGRVAQQPARANLRDEARARPVPHRAAHRPVAGRRPLQPEAAGRLTNWLEPLMRRESYLALLLERPPVHQQLLPRWARQMARPLPAAAPRRDRRAGGDALMAERFVVADFERELAQRLKPLQSTGEDDDETLLNLLRRAQHAETFRTLARDVGGRITVEQVADDRRSGRQSVLRITTQWCWNRLKTATARCPSSASLATASWAAKSWATAAT